MADAPSIDDLVAAALQDDPDDAWDAVQALHRLGTREALDAAVRLASSDSVRERVRAADILGQLGAPRRTFPDACLSVLMGLLTTADAHPEVVAAASTALGHLHPALAPAQRAVVAAALAELSGHPEPDVRFGVVHGLSGLDEPQAVAALIQLSTDADADVRNWATFGIGSLTDIGGATVCDALAARLADADADVRGEALVGLARRRDRRAVEPLQAELSTDDPSLFAIRAAEVFGDDALIPLLEVHTDADDTEVAGAAAAAIAALRSTA